MKPDHPPFIASPGTARRPRSARHVLSATAALVATLALAACHKAPPPADAPRDVVVLPARADGGARALTVPGEVQARFVTPMAFRVAGQVVERRVHLGDTVRKGDIVARLDPVDADHNAASAAADAVAARAHLAAAARQLRRDTEQARDQLVSVLQLEQTQDAYAAAQAQVAAAEARAAVAGNQRRYTDLLAEHDGVISAEQANTGEVLAAGQPVFSLAWSGATDVTTDVAESQVAGVRVGAPATVKLGALPGRALAGRVREVSPSADPQSRTYRVKVTLDAPATAVRLGMSGTVTIDTFSQNVPAAQAVVIPATALFHQGDRPAVWLVGAVDGTLELRPVTVDAYGERSVTVSAGLAAGERVVVQGVHTLTAGQKARPVAPLHVEDFAP